MKIDFGMHVHLHDISVIFQYQGLGFKVKVTGAIKYYIFVYILSALCIHHCAAFIDCSGFCVLHAYLP